MRTHLVVLGGHLTRDDLASALARVSVRTSERCGLVVDCRTMTGYDAEARAHFVEWNREHRKSIVGIAIVTDNRLWSMVIGAMSLASSQRMRAWSTVEDARAWLDTLG
jgi:hypothetical protein